MAIFNCAYCGKEFKAKPSAKRQYCSKECANKGRRGKAIKARVEKIEVTCAECGKKEYVNPCRAKNYLCCSVECLGKYNSKRYFKGEEHICPICGKKFKVKPFRANRIKTIICCSKDCASKLKETTYLGENNHQFGLKGHLNASFKGLKTKKYNNHLEDVWVYSPDHPEANKDGRITEHRLNVLDNYTKFDPCFFTKVDDYITFNPDKTLKVCVHHINGDHSDNNIDNLIPLTKASHRKVHSNSLVLAERKLREIIGVVKRGELLETPEVDNQQPSADGDVCEGSETNSRVLPKDSNADTSTLLNNIQKIIDDYIVQTRNITMEGYESSINEILESEIKSSEINT